MIEEQDIKNVETHTSLNSQGKTNTSSVGKPFHFLSARCSQKRERLKHHIMKKEI